MVRHNTWSSIKRKVVSIQSQVFTVCYVMLAILYFCCHVYATTVFKMENGTGLFQILLKRCIFNWYLLPCRQTSFTSVFMWNRVNMTIHVLVCLCLFVIHIHQYTCTCIKYWPRKKKFMYLFVTLFSHEQIFWPSLQLDDLSKSFVRRTNCCRDVFNYIQ